MGKISRGILGGFSGKVANVVGSSWKGIAYMKSLPLSVANPRTSGQIAQRTKFANTVAFASEILSTIIKPLWDRFAQSQSGYNAFVQANIDLFEGALASPPEDLKISQGKMDSTAITLIEAEAGSSNISVDWPQDGGEGLKLDTDLAYFLLVNETQGNFGVLAGTKTRDGEDPAVAMPTALVAGDVMRGYLAFKRADGTVVSNTAYATEVSQ